MESGLHRYSKSAVTALLWHFNVSGSTLMYIPETEGARTAAARSVDVLFIVPMPNGEMMGCVLGNSMSATIQGLLS